MKFKAAILIGVNKPLEIDEIEPTSLKVGQVLVKNLITGVCGAQLQEIAGNKGNAKFIPHLLGHEGCGVVEEYGPGVKLKTGDKVVLHWRKGSGIESEFPQYSYKGGKISSGLITTFSEYSIVSENRLTKVKGSAPDHLCSLLGCGLSTAMATITNECQLKFGQRILILGCGGVGSSLIYCAQKCGGDVFGLDKPENQIKVTMMGAKMPNGEDFDCIVDTTGSGQLVYEWFDKLKPSGRLILVGQFKPGDKIQLNPASIFDGTGKMIKATQGGGFNPPADLDNYLKYFEKENDYPSLISQVFSGIDNINKAIELTKNGEGARYLINL